MASVLYPAKRLKGGSGWEVYDVCLCVLHVGVQDRMQLSAGKRLRDGCERDLDCDVCGLGIPGHFVRGQVCERPVERKNSGGIMMSLFKVFHLVNISNLC